MTPGSGFNNRMNRGVRWDTLEEQVWEEVSLKGLQLSGGDRAGPEEGFGRIPQ